MILYHLTLANLKMIARDRQALFWALAFPLLFVFVFGLFFRETGSAATIAVIDKAGDAMSRGLIEELDQIDRLVVERRDDEMAARREVSEGELGHLLIIPESLASTVANNPPARMRLLFDDASPFGGILVGVVQSFVDKTNLELAQAPTRLVLSPEGVSSSAEGESSRNVSYIDFLVPGLAVWGVMSFSIIGLATNMASYREKKILVRIQSTPLKVRIFVAAQVLASLILSLGQASVILAAGSLVFGVEIQAGHLPHIYLLILMGNLVFLNMGFIVGAFSKTVAAASGLGNAVALPLMFLSGVFFPTDTLPTILLTIVKYLPLAPLLEMVRGVALDSQPFWAYPPELAIVGVWIIATAVVAMRTFRFR